MFLVVVSRVRKLSDLLFVGDVHDTLNCISEILNMTCPKWKYIEGVMSRRNPYIIHREIFSNHTEVSYLPEEHSAGYIYFLVSTKNKHQRHIGLTLNLRKELNDINSGK